MEIKRVRSRSDMKRFARFPNELYRDNPYYVPQIELDEIDTFTPKKNPAFDHCEAAMFLALDDGRVVGRIAAILNKLANETWAAKRMRFTRFDFIDDLEVSGALLAAAESWAREKGMEEMQGPIGFCDLDKQGMLIEGFEESSMFLTIYNYPYYITHMEHHGYQKGVDWIEIQVEVPKEPDPKVEKAAAYIMKKLDLRVIPIRKKKDLLAHIRDIFALVDQAYRPLFGVVPLTKRQVEFYIEEYFRFVRKEYVVLVENRRHELVGFGLAMPSLSVAARKSRGRLLPLGLFRMLRAIYGSHDVLDLMLIAVRPDMQDMGISSVMMHEVAKVAIRNGVRVAETGPSLETNGKMWLQWRRFPSRQHKRRRCWSKPL